MVSRKFRPGRGGLISRKPEAEWKTTTGVMKNFGRPRATWTVCGTKLETQFNILRVLGYRNDIQKYTRHILKREVITHQIYTTKNRATKTKAKKRGKNEKWNDKISKDTHTHTHKKKKKKKNTRIILGGPKISSEHVFRFLQSLYSWVILQQQKTRTGNNAKWIYCAKWQFIILA